MAKTRVGLQLSRGRSCVICGVQDGTIVPAHYTGPWQHQFGKGMSAKCDDLFTADLCANCHKKFDSPAKWKDREASEEFLAAILLSLLRDKQEGRLFWK